MTSTSDKSEVRKIQFTGRSTYILSLPKRWMIEMNLKAGDPVTITRESNNSLSIIPNAERRPDSANEVTAIVLQSERGSSLKRKVVSMYLAGYNIMHLKSKTGRINPSQRDAVREVVRRNLVATEIIADASDLITIQVLLSLPELSVNAAVRRMFLISTAMHTDAMASLAEQNHELATTIIKSDDEVDRFSLYILRNLVIALQKESMLQEIGLKGISECLSYRVVVRSIERVADHAAGIANKCLKITEKIPNEVFQKIDNMSRFSLVLLNDSVEAFLRRDYNLADNIVDKAEDVRSLENEIIKFLEKVTTSTSARNESINVNIKLILEDIRRTAEHASDIAEASMNETIGEVIEKISITDHL
ncbi:MAG: phosphate uptake regulator PhoU [Candidatus Nitrosopolaris sp.]